MDRQSPEAITEEALEIMRSLVECWLDAKQHGYGVAKYMCRAYQIYPLGYYAALWSKANPEEPVDLLAEYSNRAIETDDEELKLHVVGTFGDFRHPLYRYPAALTVLEPYLRNVDPKSPDSPMWQALVESLGSLRSTNPADVDVVLDTYGAPGKLIDDIKAASFHKPLPQVYVRSTQVFVDILAKGPQHRVERLIEIFEKTLQVKSMGKALGIFGNEIIDFISEIGGDIKQGKSGGSSRQDGSTP